MGRCCSRPGAARIEEIESPREMESPRLGPGQDAHQDRAGMSGLGGAMILGFDPGRAKCGIAVMGSDRALCYHAVVMTEQAIATLADLRQRFPITLLVMGDQTTAKEWQRQLSELPDPLPIVMVDERYSTLEARDRYWQMFPAKGLNRLVPASFRTMPRAIDDIVAILLIERYLDRPDPRAKTPKPRPES